MLARALGAGALAGAAGLGWAVAETRMFTVRTHTVPVLEPGRPSLRILHLSDLHLTPWQRLKQRWVASLAELRPDLVVSTGDNLAHVDSVAPLRESLADLLELPGVFVLGSNDYYAPQPKNPARYLLPAGRRNTGNDDDLTAKAPTLPTEALISTLESGGWLDLTNTRAAVTVGGQDLTFVGVDDPHLNRDHFPPTPFPAEIGDLGGNGGPIVRSRHEKYGLDAGDGAGRPAPLHIGVTHAPYLRVLDQMLDDGCAMIFAGHTHGGQLRVPGYGALVTNCDLDTGRASGLHGWPGPRPDELGGQRSTWLNVSAGLGTSPYTPVRFACRPEVSVLDLVPRR